MILNGKILNKYSSSNTFFEDLLHPHVGNLFCILQKLHYICNEKINAERASSW